MNNRDNRIVALRAVAILIVVIGHSIVLYDPAWGIYSSEWECEWLKQIKEFINIIQMPLFFFISGYCFKFSIGKDNGAHGYVLKKTKRLLIPFCLVGFLYMLPLRKLSRYPFWENVSLLEIMVQIFSGKDTGHLWYLGTLFVISILFYLIWRIRKAKLNLIDEMVLGTVLLFASICSKFTISRYFVRTTAQYMVWYWFGKVVSEHTYRVERVPKRYYTIGLMLSVLYGCGHVLKWIPENGIWRLVICLMTSIMILSIYGLMPKKEIGVKWIEILSENSMGIYLFHSPLLYIGFCYFTNMPPYVMVPINVVVSILIPMAITKGLRNSKSFSIILGE